MPIPESELRWSFTRSGGPGGQNVNKVASKAVLHWHVASSRALPEEVKARLQVQQHRRINDRGELVLSSERYRDQGRNIADCRQKLEELVRQAAKVPRPRKKTRPSAASRLKRREAKRRRAAVKQRRRRPQVEE
jgi:ribosome-associated protein